MTVLLFVLTGCTGQFFKGPNDVAALSIAPTNASIQMGSTQQFSATAAFQYPDGNTGDVTPRTTWTSSDPSIATIDSAGLATGVAYGTVTIKGSCEGFTAKTNLTVSSQTVTLTSIAVTPSSATLSLVNRTQQFTATGTYSNGSSANITNSVVWTSSDQTVATVGSNTGLASAVAAGTATITATSGAISGNTTLTVTQ